MRTNRIGQGDDATEDTNPAAAQIGNTRGTKNIQYSRPGRHAQALRPGTSLSKDHLDLDINDCHRRHGHAF